LQRWPGPSPSSNALLARLPFAKVWLKEIGSGQAQLIIVEQASLCKTSAKKSAGNSGWLRRNFCQAGLPEQNFGQKKGPIVSHLEVCLDFIGFGLFPCI